MTVAINTSGSLFKSPAKETTSEGRESSTIAGNFAWLMDQAIRPPGAKSRKAAGQTPTDAAPSDEEKDSDMDEISPKRVSPEDKNAPTAPSPTWLSGMPGTVFGQPIPTFTQPAHFEAQELSALPEHSGLEDSGCAFGLITPTVGSAGCEPSSSILQPALAAPKLSGPDSGEKRDLAIGDPTHAHAEKSILAAERPKVENVPLVQVDDSQAEGSEAGSGTELGAHPSDSKSAAAGSLPASVVPVITAHEPALMTAVSARGTLAAQHTGTMQATPEMNETACLGEQNMPCLPAAIEAAVPAGRERKALDHEVDRLAGLCPGVAEMTLALADQPPQRELSTYTDAAAPQAVGVEGVRRAVENAAATLRRVDASSLSLVLTPDGNTQLALHVELQQGRCEVRAVLERGDFAALGAEWSQLQNRLAEQGVHLAPLSSSTGTGNAFAGAPSFSHQRGREEMPSGELPMPTPAKSEAHKSGLAAVVATNGRAWWA